MTEAEKTIGIKEKGDLAKGKKKSVQYQRDQDREKVKGIFHYYEVPGGQVSFAYRCYKGDSIEKYTLVDKHMYTIPLGVAKHLNKNCAYNVHKFEMDENDKPTMKVGQKVRRMGFQSLEFVDVGEFENEPSKIVTVEKVL